MVVFVLNDDFQSFREEGEMNTWSMGVASYGSKTALCDTMVAGYMHLSKPLLPVEPMDFE